MPWLVAILTLLAAYLVGAIPFGYLIARWHGVDIFEHGSGNIGATNVGRVLGRKFGVLVFVLDFAKGAGPVALALVLKRQFDDELWTRGYIEVGAGMAAFLGHCFPVYLKFHGGKGIATGAGVVLVLLPIPMLIALCVWIVVLCAARTVSLASIACIVVLCAAHLRQPEAWDWREPRTWFCLIAGGLAIARHHENIVRLLKGTENQLKDNLAMHQLTKSLHVLALGLWFGMSIFFSFVVAFALFGGLPQGTGGFQTLANQEKRESWFPHVKMYSGDEDGVNGAEEQGTRAAGYVIGPIFTWYFALQGLCGFIALATALPWLKRAPGSRMHRWRVNLLIAAIALVLVGWWMERKVHELRMPRNQTTEAYLRDRADEAKKTEMIEARAEFRTWHLGSVFLNLATIVCVTGAMALAGNLESESVKPNLATDETRMKHG
jgi:acyl-phosphate glycerol 3-phosphate acyltransferase